MVLNRLASKHFQPQAGPNSSTTKILTFPHKKQAYHIRRLQTKGFIFPLILQSKEAPEEEADGSRSKMKFRVSTKQLKCRDHLPNNNYKVQWYSRSQKRMDIKIIQTSEEGCKEREPQRRHITKGRMDIKIIQLREEG